MKIKAFLLSLVGAFAVIGTPARAQVVPNQPSTAVNSSAAGHVILGGSAQQQNLFHSFSQFDTSGEQFANFIVTPDITNVISRVTDSETYINGVVTITLDGTNLAPDVNLFLLSPQGIRFGPNTVTNIDGAFVASTANSLTFADNTTFDASSSQPAMLTVSTPTGLQFGTRPMPIAVEGINADSPFGGINSLGRGQNLVLVGGDVSFTDRDVSLLAGRLQAAGLSTAGNVSLTSSRGFLSAALPEGVARADVSTSDAVTILASGPVESLNISARNFRMTAPPDPQAQGRLLVGVSDRAQLPFRVGDINIDVTDSVELTNSSVYNGIELNAVGNTGNLNINARSLYLTGGAQIATFNHGTGDAGDLNVNIRESVEIDGRNSLAPTRLTGLYSVVGDLRDNTQGLGLAGNLNLTTDSLTVRNGGLISASTLAEGDAGNVDIMATSHVLLTGANDLFGTPSSISSSVELTGKGDGGSVDVIAPTLMLDRGAAIVGRTQGAGDAGAISLTLDVLETRNGGQVFTTSFTDGNSGDIEVTARDRIELSGSDRTYTQRLALSPFNETGGANSGIYANTTAASSGTGGLVTIRTGELVLSEAAQLSASSQGTGAAGGLDIAATRQVQLSQSTIQAESRGGDRGNIELAAPVLLLRDRSQITTNAMGEATGGNITLNTPIVVGLGNSDIVARATQGAGGNIDIQSSGLFGIAPRPQLTPGNDINASSDVGLNGTVAISTPSVDPDSGLVELPSDTTDSTNELSAGCSASQNTFTASGRGGLPSTPYGTLTSNRPWQDFRPTQMLTEAESSATPRAQAAPTDPIVEASAWRVNHNDEVVLSSAIAQLTPQQQTTCMRRAENMTDHS